MNLQFKKKQYLTYFIDNKIYKQETGLPDAYGIIRNHPKTNKELQLKIDSMKNEVDNYIVHVYKGLEAYKKFGYRCVFGVIEIKRKE